MGVLPQMARPEKGRVPLVSLPQSVVAGTAPVFVLIEHI